MGYVAWVDFLIILKTTGMGVSDMTQYVELRSKGINSLSQRQSMLTKHLELATLNRIELERTENVLNEKLHFSIRSSVARPSLHEQGCLKGNLS